MLAASGCRTATSEPPSVTWDSLATGGAVKVTLLSAASAPTSDKQPLVIYLLNLAAPRVGTESDEPIIRDLRKDGFAVAVFDYAGHRRSQWPDLNRDLVEIRTQIHRGDLFPAQKPDPARIFIVPSGHRLRRDVVYFEDGSRTLALDVIYPSKPRSPVGAVLEFTCDNANRMGNFSLQYCTDSLLEGAATAGFAVAMADHPIAAPYKGFDAMQDSIAKVKSAVRKVRGLGPELGLNDRIVTLGFSRGSGMALAAATTMGFDPPNLSEHGSGSTDVSGAVVLSGRFTYLDLLPDDPMIPRYVAAWGDRERNEPTWRSEGAADYLDLLQGPTVPLFLSINVTESPHALHQMEVLRRRLEMRGLPFEYHPETKPRGHPMPLEPAVLNPLLSYLRDRLAP
jgi:hypothetical protein